MSADKPPAEEHLIHVRRRRGGDRASPGGLDRLRDLLGLAFIVFLQFFTRYVLNDSLPGPRRSRATA
jgi:hypothetical protein